ncbi:MAG: OmpH family outer membrane protein [Paludibacteraceae bacterium]|nr:OmpH family outer membrane protein [Paludibacteraceae bacterium]
MNKIQTSVNIVLALAVVALFVLHFTSKQSTSAPAAEAVAVENGAMPIAYLNVDSLLANYTFAQEAQETLMTKQEDARLKLNSKARTLQKEMSDFQQKYDNHAFLSAERAQSEYQRLQKKQQELEELEAKLTQDIMTENQKLNLQLADSLTAFLNDYNADGRFHVILSNNAKDNVLMANPSYDITAAVVEGLNKRYKK